MCQISQLTSNNTTHIVQPVFQGEARCFCRWQYQSLRSRPGTDEMAVVDVKARFQTGTTDNLSNQILKISDSDMDSGVFNVFVIISKVK